VQTVCIWKVSKVGNRLQNLEFGQINEFRDPGKQ
jgi:hypothetical protein